MSTETPYETTRPAPRSARHPVRVTHLVSGLVLLGLAAAWALWQGGVVGGNDVRWVLPVPLLIAGAAGLAVSAANGLRHAESSDEPDLS